MREILFKAIDVHSGKWVYGYPKLFVDVRPVMMTNMGDRIIARKTVCQFTGLKDCNGAKLFEGDICEYQGTEFPGEHLRVVSFHRGSWCYALVDFTSYKQQFGEFEAEASVIAGNIHDK